MSAIWFGLCLLAIVVGAGWTIAFMRFRAQPQYRWREQILALARKRAVARAHLLQNTPRTVEQAVALEQRRALQKARSKVSIDGLQMQTGIGPGTLQTLRQVGIETLVDVLNVKLTRMPGIGPQKAFSLQQGAVLLLSQFEADFIAKKNDSGRTFAHNEPAIRAEAANQIHAFDRAVQAIDEEIKSQASKVQIARQITFWRYLREQPVVGWAEQEPPKPAHMIPDPRSNSTLIEQKSNSHQPPAPSTETFEKLLVAAEFGMFLVHHAGKGRNERAERLRDALCEMFKHEPEVNRLVVTAINKHIKPRIDAGKWFDRLRQMLTSTDTIDHQWLLAKVLRSGDHRSDDEEMVANRWNQVSVNDSSPPIVNPKQEQKRVAASAHAANAVPAAVTPAKNMADPFEEVFRSKAISNTAPTSAITTEAIQLRRLEAFARFGMLTAYADGRLAAAEKAEVRLFLIERFGPDPALVRRIDPLIERLMIHRPSESDTLIEVKAVANGPEEWQQLSDWAKRIATRSSGINDRELELLKAIDTIFGIPIASAVSKEVRQTTRQINQPPSPDISIPSNSVSAVSDPRSLLDIPLDVPLTAELIRRRFRLKSEQFKGDRLADLGAEFVRLAEAKQKEIESAAVALLKAMGELLEPSPRSVDAESGSGGNLRDNALLDDIFGA